MSAPDHDLCIISARGTGKSWGIALVTSRDAAQIKEKHSSITARPIRV